MLRKGKGKEARLVFMAHALMENRHGMLVDFSDHPSDGYGGAGYCAGTVGASPGTGLSSQNAGGGKGYDTRDCVADLRRRG